MLGAAGRGAGAAAWSIGRMPLSQIDTAFLTLRGEPSSCNDGHAEHGMMLKMPAPLDTAPQTIELGTELARQSLNRDATRPLLLTRDLCTADPSRPRRQNDQAPSRDEQPVDAIAMLTVEHWLVNDLFTQEARAGNVTFPRI